MKTGKQKTISTILLTAVLAVGGFQLVSAQMPGTPGAGPSGPIDITADEQEFAGDSVIARGRVRVVYKDSVIHAPLATLYKDPAGNPNRAIFTGHPHLTQGSNKIDANTLTFEMAINKIIADGNAHSEVDVPEDEQKESPTATPQTKAAAPAKPANEFDDDDEDTPPPVAAKPAETKSDEKKPAAKKAEKIITDSERQEYDQASGRFDALGHVKVVHGDITVLADKLQLVYGATNDKPETAIFTGHVIATQGKNTTCADNMNYSLSTKRLQATGHVKSKVIQEKKEGQAAPKKKTDVEDPTAKADIFGAPAQASNIRGTTGTAAADKKGNGPDTSIASFGNNDKPVWVYSDAQDYSRDNGRVAAHGNVRVVSGEMYGVGPSIILLKKPDGRADKIVFRGRSQISQPGRRWIADEIIYIVDEHRVIANGNAKAMILQSPEEKAKQKLGPGSTPTAPAQQQNVKYAESGKSRIGDSTTPSKRSM